MKISRSLLIWSTLALCGVMVIGAMFWLTRSVLAAESERIEAESRADLEERTRLALWRMDARGAALMLRENGHPADQFSAQAAPPHEPCAEVQLHFELRKDDQPTFSELSNTDGPSPQDRTAVEDRIKRLRAVLAANPLPSDEWTLLNEAARKGETGWQAIPQEAVREMKANAIQRQQKSPDTLRKDSDYQANGTTQERSQRAKAVFQTLDNSVSKLAPAAAAVNPISQEVADRSTTLRQVAQVSQMRPIWLGNELFLLRQVTWSHSTSGADPTGREFSIQGAWLEVAALRESLLRETSDLLPTAKLLPVEGPQAANDPLSLVSFPFHLQRNETAVTPVSITLNGPLCVGWAAVMLALLTTSLLVHGVMRLSERRASFVSAVTHELRTPLTTFRLYSDMLGSGAVKPAKRSDYLRVLSREADRLSHLVENVLSFSQVERGSARSVVRETTATGLLEPLRERLSARLAAAGLTLEMTTRDDLNVRLDAAAVEHILFNLIDNAAKYATASEPPTVEIGVLTDGRHLEITVSDHGPGIPVSERRRIFRAFHKSAREAAESRPGVGLGLALSRRLAKALGGSIECVDAPQGARFVLRLPRA
jgi:signal transduction histidine kinase